MLDIQNLDGMWPDDLRAYAASLKPRERSFVTIQSMYRQYAHIKANAMDLRSIGMISHALTLEAQCERIYNLLPERARW